MQRQAEPLSGTILVIDDNEANRSLVSHTLEDEGYRVVVASGGAEGIAAFERALPDCILLDIRMPTIDGFAVCQHIRAAATGSETPVIFLTAQRDVDTFDRALEVGGDDFLPKPVRPAELLVRVQTALKMSRMSAELRSHFDLVKHQRDDLLRLQLQKERLMAFVVHDLKNPVNTMDLYAQMVLRDRTVPDDTRRAASEIRAAAKQLVRLILNLLDLSKADEGKLEPKVSAIDLCKLLTGVVGDLEMAAQASAVRVSWSSAPTLDRIRADEDLLRRALTNLVENAIRHAPEGTDVTVAATGSERAVEIRVADRGKGVPTSMREHIFDPFVQIGDTVDATMTRGGRGLGLAFCKVAVECHGGRIWIEDADPGAILAMSLPQ
jgi:two-component system sensor histidine kinase/response regulator